MIKQDEIILWKEIWKEINTGVEHPYFREIAKRLKIPTKRAGYIFQKWDNKNLTDCGVSIMAGWMKDETTENSLTGV